MSTCKGIPQDKIEAGATAPPAKTTKATAAVEWTRALVSGASAKFKTVIAGQLRTIARLPSKQGALLAASVTVAAALGALVGSLGITGMASAPPDVAESAATGQNRNLQAALAQLGRDVAALKANVEASNRVGNTQFAKITESVARLEQRIAAASTQDVTGSVTNQPTAKEAPKPTIVEGWVLRDAQRGHAWVESRYGLYEVVPGAILPGIGRVETIARQNGRWVVVTPSGLIVSMR